LFNVQGVRYNPTRTQQAALSEKGVNPVIINFNKVAVFGEGSTFAAEGSDYIRLTTKRIVDEAANLVRQVTQKFVGEPSTVQMRNSMETAISSALRGMQLLGALLTSDFNITYIPAENKAIVDLVLTPAFELKAIQVQIAINV
jgi:phage tail sheath protein FI